MGIDSVLTMGEIQTQLSLGEIIIGEENFPSMSGF